MNSSTGLILAVLLTVLAIAHGKIDWEESEKNFNTCKEETKADETFEDTIKKGRIPTSDKGMCLMDCLLRVKGIYDKDSKYNAEGAKAYMTKKFSHLPENIDKAIAIVEECSKIDIEGLDKCEAAVKHLTCAKAKAAQQNISLND